jgi:hypothetical protein
MNLGMSQSVTFGIPVTSINQKSIAGGRCDSKE